jgi:hypothetical protein
LNLVKGFEMPAHKHADLMLQYAQDAMKTETPWERWEVEVNGCWADFDRSPCWDTKLEYRRKLEVITINGIEVPPPMRVAPATRTMYFYVDIAHGRLCGAASWSNLNFDKNLLSRGLCHRTEEAATKHAEALLSFTKQD